MTLTLTPVPVPIRFTDDGAARIGDTRIPLSQVIEAFQLGVSPEELILQFPSLKLADLYAVLAYYLHNQATVDTFLADGRRKSLEFQGMIEAQYPTGDDRARLLARRLLQAS